MKTILTSSSLALAMTVAMPFVAHGQAQPNQPPAVTSSPSTQPPTGAAPPSQTPEPRTADSTRRWLPSTASALPFIALVAILAVTLGAAIRIGVNTID